MTIHDNLRAAAIRVIERFTPDGPNCVWKHRGDPEEPQSVLPVGGWKYHVAVDNELYIPVRVAFVPDELEDRQTRKYAKNSEIATGQVNGFMGFDASFLPALNDVVYRPTPDNDVDVVTFLGGFQGAPDFSVGYDTYTPRAIDNIRPEHKIVLYVLEFGI